MLVRDVMTPAPASCLPESLLREVAELMVEHDCGAIPVTEAASGKVVGTRTCTDLMAQHQVRRIPVVDGDGHCCGIVAQADIARNVDDKEMKADLVETVSEPNSDASRAAARS